MKAHKSLLSRSTSLYLKEPEYSLLKNLLGILTIKWQDSTGRHTKIAMEALNT